MKLIIKRNQQAQTGVFGGHKGMTFLLSYRVELTSDEKALIAKYKAEHHALTYTSRDGTQLPKDTISSLIQGTTEEVKDITILLNNEQIIKDACKNFKTLLEVMATFGGEEVIEF
jgi:hypothetical protein